MELKALIFFNENRKEAQEIFYYLFTCLVIFLLNPFMALSI